MKSSVKLILPIFVFTFVSFNANARMIKDTPVGEIPFSMTGDGRIYVTFDEVIVGPYIMPKVPGALSTLTSGMLSKEDIDGMIGNNFLKRFNMVVDFKNKRIYLQPNNLYYSPFYDHLIK